MTGTGQKDVKSGTNTGELTRPESAGEPVGNSLAVVRYRGAVHQCPAIAERSKSGKTGVLWATLKRLVSGTQKRVSKCAALRLHGKHIGM